MRNDVQETAYLPAERSTPELVSETNQRIQSWPPVVELLERAREPIFLMNEQRQIVYANQLFVGMCEATSSAALLGKRHGEALECVNSTSEGGCGTTVKCRRCKLAGAILTALRWGGGDGRQLLQVMNQGPREIPVQVRVEGIQVGDQRLLFCRIASHGVAPEEHPMPPESAPLELAELYQILVSGGPFCPA